MVWYRIVILDLILIIKIEIAEPVFANSKLPGEIEIT